MIEQTRWSKSVRFFEKDFCERWNLRTYHDPNAPCFFAGVYRPEDVDIINRHKGFKVVWNNGRVRENLFPLLDPTNMVVLKYTDSIDHSSIERKYKIKQARFEIKDYSMFQPNKLGDSICVYLGNESGKYIMGFDEVEKLRKLIKHPILVSMQGHSREWVKENIYDKSFVYFKPIEVGGVETGNELALMGRKTISPAKGEYYINYETIEQAAELIEIEANKIGTVQGNVLHPNYFDTGEEWKQVKFWL